MPRFLFLLMLAGPLLASAAPQSPADWNRAQIPPMKTSIYIGSVTLTTEPFVRDGNTITSTYAARVFPWAFWNETGRISIHLTEENLARLQRGERCEFTGEAFNHKNKPRHVTGRAEPSGPNQGKIKVRIGVDDFELVFNGPYALAVFSMQAAEIQMNNSPTTPAP